MGTKLNGGSCMIQIRKSTVIAVTILLVLTATFAIAQVQESAHQQQKRQDLQERLENL